MSGKKSSQKDKKNKNRNKSNNNSDNNSNCNSNCENKKTMPKINSSPLPSPSSSSTSPPSSSLPQNELNDAAESMVRDCDRITDEFEQVINKETINKCNDPKQSSLDNSVVVVVVNKKKKLNCNLKERKNPTSPSCKLDTTEITTRTTSSTSVKTIAADIETSSTAITTTSNERNQTTSQHRLLSVRKRKICEDSPTNDSNTIIAGPSTSTNDEQEDKDGDKDAKKKKNRCAVCRKKVGLTGFECRCGGLYCAVHRYSDKHDCTFDYREHGAQEIRRNNPVVVGEKIQKI